MLMPLPFWAQAQLEAYSRFTADGRIEPNINYFGSKKLTEKISLTFFGLVEQKWSEALIGASFAASASFRVGASVGIEHGTNSPRYSVSLFTAKGKTTLAALGELGYGNENYLYKVNLFHKCSDQFTVGATAWRYHGVGPNFRLTILKLQSTIWLMPAYDFEANQSKCMLGVSVNMAK